MNAGNSPSTWMRNRGTLTGFATSGTIWERIGEALSRQHIALSAILQQSSYTEELMSEPKRAGFRFEARHLRTEERIVEELRGAQIAEAAFLARIVASSAHGISQKIEDADAVRRAIKLMCRRLIEPEMPG